MAKEFHNLEDRFIKAAQQEITGHVVLHVVIRVGMENNSRNNGIMNVVELKYKYNV